jgi:hypothetical protein
VQVSATADGAARYEDDASVALAYAPDGQRIALGRNGQVRVVDLAGGVVAQRDLSAYTSVAFGPDGATLALATVVSDENSRLVGQVDLWDIAASARRAVLATAPEDFVFDLGGTGPIITGGRGKASPRTCSDVPQSMQRNGEGELFEALCGANVFARCEHALRPSHPRRRRELRYNKALPGTGAALS